MSQHSSARQHHKHALDVAHPPPRPGTPRAVLVPVAVVLLIGTVFVSVYLAAFHAPRPHELRVGTTEIGTHQASLRRDLARRPGRLHPGDLPRRIHRPARRPGPVRLRGLPR
ncbi:hypothetical protein [Streptomyces sp. WAC00263]|uniref:hypothetical protein n=1 Tax=Streptomyces sp. WAC00263 TaxID=1917422 RepID=UPI001F514C6B|nr:hypothetical protein [Streptomyces sp. WAC00263]